ncbi:hypothetical protein HYDPIDRAFT_24674 [Hydnomerulius pinastri MD-312]|nr:hypothetical protein HYDPIDRAFT_24674 [Hydnomerulius pinastri MD-312]
MSETPSPKILNPDIYLNYLEPSIASQYEVSRNVYLVTLGALLWDILSSIPEDWRLIRTSKPAPVLFAYLSARACALAVVLLAVLEKTGPINKCGVLALILCVFWVIASAASSYLFLKRVHVVFIDNKIIRRLFTFLWLVGVGTSCLALPGPIMNYYEISDTAHCINHKIKQYVSAAFIIPVLFDALVFLAITYRIISSHHIKKPRSWKAFCRGEALPRLSRAVLQGGQQYYLVTTGVNITRCILILVPSVSSVYQVTPAVPAVALTSAMACRVFRNLKLEALQDTEVGILTTMRFVDVTPVNVHLSKGAEHASAEGDLELGATTYNGTM